MRRKSEKSATERRLFEAEARPHLDTLYSTALRLTRSPVDAEDLVQDTLVRLSLIHIYAADENSPV